MILANTPTTHLIPLIAGPLIGYTVLDEETWSLPIVFLPSFGLYALLLLYAALQWSVNAKVFTDKVSVNANQMYLIPQDMAMKDVRVLTYNIFLRPPFIKTNKDDYKNERLEEFIKVMADDRFDVIALQEVFALGNWRQRKLIRNARKLGFHFHALASSPPLLSKKFIDAGLLILSRYPIVATDSLIYSFGNQIDDWAAKQVIYAKIQLTKDHCFHLFTTHMQATYKENSDDVNAINASIKLKQVQQLASFVRSKVNGCPYPLVIAGDFNINAKKSPHNHDEDSEDYLHLLRHLHQHACTECHSPPLNPLKEHHKRHFATYADSFWCPVENTWKPKDVVLTHPIDYHTSECLDHIFYLNTSQNHEARCLEIKDKSARVEEFFVESENLPFTQLSDHYGVSVALTVYPPNKMNAGE